MNQIVERQTNSSFDLSPRTVDEAMRMAQILSDSTIVPKDFTGKPGNILVAIQWGAELGLKPMQAMQAIAVINGRPSLWGDAVLALVMASPVCKDVIERYEGSGDDFAAVCIAQRHGREDKVSRFSVKDAKAAGLIGKAGPWTQYRDRMLKMRARAFAVRDQYPDVLKGMPVAEEVMDYREIPKSPADRTQAIESSDERNALIKELEGVVLATGIQAYSDMWVSKLTKAQRTMIGAKEHERLKSLAQATPADEQKQDEPQQSEAQSSADEPPPGAGRIYK